MRASGSLKAVRAFGLAVAAPGLGWTPPVHAQSTPAAPPGFWERSNLLDDLGGVRTALSKLGISYGLTSTDEVLGNVTGGVHTGADYDGLMQFGIGVDTAKALGWPGGIFNISGLEIHGRDSAPTTWTPCRSQARSRP
jgi:porin